MQCDQMVGVRVSGREGPCGRYVGCAFHCFQAADPCVGMHCASTVTLAAIWSNVLLEISNEVMFLRSA